MMDYTQDLPVDFDRQGLLFEIADPDVAAIAKPSPFMETLVAAMRREARQHRRNARLNLNSVDYEQAHAEITALSKARYGGAVRFQAIEEEHFALQGQPVFHSPDAPSVVPA